MAYMDHVTKDSTRYELMSKPVADAIAQEFSTSQAYAVGDCVFYETKLYRFTAAHAAGAWNSAHVSEVKVSDEINDLKDDLSELTADKVAIPKSENYYINLTTDPVDIANPSSSSTGLAYSIVDCIEGDKFIINAVGAVSGRACGFLDSGNHVISMADADATITNLELTAPANAVKLIINDKGDLTSYKVGKNILGRVETLETDVENLRETIESIEPGLSAEAKEALLVCFAHVAWSDEHGQTYYNVLEQALYGTVPQIRVFVGKGVDGSGAIINNANRALSEKIPLANVAPITIKYPTNTDKLYAIKTCTSDTTVGSSGAIYCPTSEIGHVWTSPYGGWCYESEEFAVAKRIWDEEAQAAGLENGAWVVTTLPSDMNGYIRLIFRGMADASSPIPSAIDKYIYINNVKYELVEIDISEFE